MDLKKIRKCVAAGTLAGVISVCSSGCGERQSFLSGTRLENTLVVTFEDGTKDIVEPISECNFGSNLQHYHSVTSGIYFADKNCPHTVLVSASEYCNHFSIEGIENITAYLTIDELFNALDGKLTNEDLSVIFNRILSDKDDVHIRVR